MNNKQTSRPMSKIWSDNLNRLYGKSGLTQDEFASYFDSEDATVYTDGRTLRKYLNGVIPNAPRLVIFAKNLHTSVEALLTGDLDPDDKYIFKRKMIWNQKNLILKIYKLVIRLINYTNQNAPDLNQYLLLMTK